ncbi:MAG TPA: D-Ala-D-Ala carboxypeptidase family metallohydrolase [Oligoflexus sp.]|uniref:D-Ala-D-Ala carboxypeptidase family metallohydrolase n=1 Tax=Oligoflexus sp. TaxID=1971216 RepID=UPI002D2F235E|nr:D-Ala-D-Ala carboxypeptidase family metallohydrolase [Oligoflexus sp.]HYX33944.1 D-Ala-D-Ala carboxypeptidase family metallohydrolase [Oligoflexus sp.]
MVTKSSPSLSLSKNFTLAEFTASTIANQHKLDNSPSPEAIQNLRWLAVHILQPLRDHFQKPIKITSGYRSEQVNLKAGGVADSDHRALDHIAAADIVIEDVSLEDIARAIYKLGLPVEQVIVEYDQKIVHISAQRARQQFLSRTSVAGKISYKAFDPSQAGSRPKGSRIA